MKNIQLFERKRALSKNPTENESESEEGDDVDDFSNFTKPSPLKAGSIGFTENHHFGQSPIPRSF